MRSWRAWVGDRLASVSQMNIGAADLSEWVEVHHVWRATSQKTGQRRWTCWFSTAINRVQDLEKLTTVDSWSPFLKLAVSSRSTTQMIAYMHTIMPGTGGLWCLLTIPTYAWLRLPQHRLLPSRFECNSLGESASTQLGIILRISADDQFIAVRVMREQNKARLKQISLEEQDQAAQRAPGISGRSRELR